VKRVLLPLGHLDAAPHALAPFQFSPVHMRISVVSAEEKELKLLSSLMFCRAMQALDEAAEGRRWGAG